MKDLAEVVSKGPCRWRQYFFLFSGNRKKDVKGIYQGRSSTKLETFLVTDFIFCATLALQRLLARALASRKHRKAPLRAVSAAGTGPKAQVSRFKKLRNTRFASQMFCLVKCDLNDLNRFNMIWSHQYLKFTNFSIWKGDLPTGNSADAACPTIADQWKICIFPNLKCRWWNISSWFWELEKLAINSHPFVIPVEWM